MDVPGHHPRRAQAEDAEKCSDKVFKIITAVVQQLGMVYWLPVVHELAVVTQTDVTSPDGAPST